MILQPSVTELVVHAVFYPLGELMANHPELVLLMW